MATYKQAIAAVKTQVPKQYAYNQPWPEEQYIATNDAGEVTVYGVSGSPLPYAPTEADKLSTAWTYNGDNPPR